MYPISIVLFVRAPASSPLGDLDSGRLAKFPGNDIFIKIPVLGTCCWCANYANHLPSYWSIKMGSQSSLDENKTLSFKKLRTAEVICFGTSGARAFRGFPRSYLGEVTVVPRPLQRPRRRARPSWTCRRPWRKMTPKLRRTTRRRYRSGSRFETKDESAMNWFDWRALNW